LNSENIFTAELRKILTYKEELLTDVKNMLYRRTDDVERLQKVIADTEQQFVGSLQQIKTLSEKDERRQKELEDLRRPPRSWWTWWIHQKEAKQASGPCWSNFTERRRKSSSYSQKPRSRVSATPSPS
jgi:hypothetical protein